MCGISGLKRMGPDSSPIGFDQIRQLLVGLEHRGLHATGMCFQYSNGRLEVIKGPEQAWKFVAGRKVEEWVAEHLTNDVMTCILHNRAWTQGHPNKNENNHPVYCGTTAIVHNGGIHNDHTLFRELKLQRRAEVDSDIIRAILDEWGLTTEGVKMLNKMNGAAAVAAVSKDYPGKLLLCRSGSPLVIAALPDRNQLIWASEKDAIHAAARPWTQMYRMWFKENHKDLLINPVEKEVAVLIGDTGEEWHMEFNCNGGRSRNIVYRQYEQQPEKKKQLREDENRQVVAARKDEKVKASPKPALMKCPNVACGVVLKFTKEQIDKPMWQLQCPDCGQRLGEQA